MRIKKIDIPPGIKEYRGNKKMLKKIELYKINRRKFKDNKIAVKETGLSDRSIRRLNLIFKHGSKLTIDNVLAGIITLAHAEKHIRSTLNQIKKRAEYMKKNGNGIKLVHDKTGNKLPEQYSKYKHEFWNQIRLAKMNKYEYISKDTISADLDNMMALID